MNLYAIYNIKTKKFVYDTDKRHHQPHQRTSKGKMLTYGHVYEAITDFKLRSCGNDYRVVEIGEPVVKTVFENITEDFEEVVGYDWFINYED